MKQYHWVINTALWLRVVILGYGKLDFYPGIMKFVNYIKKKWDNWGSIQTGSYSGSVAEQVRFQGTTARIDLESEKVLATPWSFHGEMPEPRMVDFAGGEIGQWCTGVKNYMAEVSIPNLKYGGLHGFWMCLEGASIHDAHEIDFEWMMNKRGKYALVCTVHRGGYGEDHLQISYRYPLPKRSVVLRIHRGDENIKLYVNERLIFRCNWKMPDGVHCLLASMYAVKPDCKTPQTMYVMQAAHDGYPLQTDQVPNLPKKTKYENNKVHNRKARESVETLGASLV